MIVNALIIVGAYLVGSIPTGVIVGRIRGFDPRTVGSGNIGMTNVARAGGGAAAAMTFVGDVLKGAIPVVVAKALGLAPPMIAWTALAAFVGSIYSIFLGFSGGKGVSAALGIWLVLSPSATVIALAVFVLVFAISRIVSLGSLSAAIVMPPAVAAMHQPHHYLLLATIISALVLLRFRENIARLARGVEPRFQPKRRDSTSQ